jgi:AcrR family transcriptional regulator
MSSPRGGRAVLGAMASTQEETGAVQHDRPLGRRDRKRQEVRDRLCAAALELFVEQGYEATTMEQIGERADVARATVFNYFPQKVGFLQEWGVRRRAQVAQMVEGQAAAPLPAAERLRLYLQALAELNVTSRHETAVLMDLAAHFGRLFQDPALGEVLADIIRAGQRDREFAADRDADQAGSLLAAGYFTTVLQWSGTEPEPFDLSERLDALLDLLLPGLIRAAPAR